MAPHAQVPHEIGLNFPNFIYNPKSAAKEIRQNNHGINPPFSRKQILMFSFIFENTKRFGDLEEINLNIVVGFNFKPVFVTVTDASKLRVIQK